MSIGRPEAGAHAPGKLILSGEHSVLYGAPALSMAIARYTEVWFTPLSLGEGLRTAFANLSGGATYPFKLLSSFKTTIDKRFEKFLSGDLQVHDILQQPDDLAVYTLAELLLENPTGTDILPGFGALGQKPMPGELGSRSDLQVGSGMGSSAAIVAATTLLFETLLDRPKTLSDRLDRVRFCERLQHGKAGPIDAASVVYGGLVRAQNLETNPEPLALDDGHDLIAGTGWYWILHGRPQSTTGECVAAVAAAHANDSALWDDFAECTKTFETNLLSASEPADAITQNQRLLERIGVVPAATQGLVSAIENVGGAAKICGAGSIRGEFGGAVLVRLNDHSAMLDLMTRHPDLEWDRLRMAPGGAAAGPAPTPVAGVTR